MTTSSTEEEVQQQQSQLGSVSSFQFFKTFFLWPMTCPARPIEIQKHRQTFKIQTHRQTIELGKQRKRLELKFNLTEPRATFELFVRLQTKTWQLNVDFLLFMSSFKMLQTFKVLTWKIVWVLIFEMCSTQTLSYY